MQILNDGAVLEGVLTVPRYAVGLVVLPTHYSRCSTAVLYLYDLAHPLADEDERTTPFCFFDVSRPYAGARTAY